MKKLLFIFLLFPFISNAQWNTAGVMQLSSDGFNIRINGGHFGNYYFYQKTQTDSLFQHVPFGLLVDSNDFAASKKWVKQLSGSLTAFFSPLYFRGTATSGDPLIVSNSDSLNHQAPGYYATYSQILVSRTGVHFGQTASDPNLITKANSGGDNSYDIGGFVNILGNPSLSDNIVMQVSWTAEDGTVNTQILYEPGATAGSTMTAVREHGLQHIFIRVKDATTITISTTVAGSGSILYNDGGLINKVVGDGGL